MTTVKKIKDFDYSKELVIDRLVADPRIIQFHIENLKKTFPDMTPQQLDQRISAIVLHDNKFNAAMHQIVSCVEFNYDEEEIKQQVANIKSSIEQQQKQQPEAQRVLPPDEYLTSMLKRQLEKDAIFNLLQNEWNVIISDKEVDDMLMRYYQETNQSIREYKEHPEKIESIKKEMLNQKIASEIINKFKFKIDHESIQKHMQEQAEKIKARQEELKKQAEAAKAKAEEQK